MHATRLPALLLLALTACAGTPAPGARAQSPGNGGFSPTQLAKTDIDRVAEAHRRQAYASLRLVAEKLYRRNPREWRRGGAVSGEAAVARLFDDAAWRFSEFGERRGVEVLQIAFRDDYQGDRVFALIAGLGGMVHAAFNEKEEFFVLDDLDPQKLYNAARNVEIAVWKLSQARDADHNLYLLSNEMMPASPAANLSFEREFGKIIGGLDTLSKIIADRSQRTIVKLLQSVATAVFLPVPGR
jgi:hypothetical protein